MDRGRHQPLGIPSGQSRGLPIVKPARARLLSAEKHQESAAKAHVIYRRTQHHGGFSKQFSFISVIISPFFIPAKQAIPSLLTSTT